MVDKNSNLEKYPIKVGAWTIISKDIIERDMNFACLKYGSSCPKNNKMIGNFFEIENIEPLVHKNVSISYTGKSYKAYFTKNEDETLYFFWREGASKSLTSVLTDEFSNWYDYFDVKHSSKNKPNDLTPKMRFTKTGKTDYLLEIIVLN